MNPAHPLPAGCNITDPGHGARREPGRAEGLRQRADARRRRASSQAIDYAVDVAGVDVLNESFGGNPFPDNANDPVAIADDAAVAAGVTVVASTGDAGTNGTIGSPSTAPAGSSASPRTTTLPVVHRRRPDAGVQLSQRHLGRRTTSPALSSGGVHLLAGGVPDLAAPGDQRLGAVHAEPRRLRGVHRQQPAARSPIQNFGGTSQSSPLTAGAAALVIQAYELRRHGGDRPTPALVKRLLTEHRDRPRPPGLRAGRRPTELPRGGPGREELARTATARRPATGQRARCRTRHSCSSVGDPGDQVSAGADR